MSRNIKQYNNISLLGVTIQGNCKFGLHVKAKLHEANKCLFVIRSLRKEGYTQDEIDHPFNSIVIPKLLYGLSHFVNRHLEKKRTYACTFPVQRKEINAVKVRFTMRYSSRKLSHEKVITTAFNF